MKAVESSLSYEAVRTAYRWVGRCAASSLVGRACLQVGRSSRPALAGSRSLGTGRVRSAPLVDALTARPVLVFQGALAGGAAGRGLRTLAQAVPFSGLAEGNWARVLGAAAIGLGAGLLSGRVVLGAVLLILGMVGAVAGPRLLEAMPASLSARFLRSVPSAVGGAERSRRWSVAAIGASTWAAMLLALVAGVLAAAGSETGKVVGITVAVALAVAAMLRPQLVLLAVAAFPWLDWAARSTLGSLGPLWDDALLVASVALIVWAVLVLGRDVPRSVPITFPAVLMVVLAAASIVVNRVPDAVAFYALRVLFEPILFYFVGFLIPKERAWVRLAVGIFVASTTLLALHGLYQYLTHTPTPANWVDVAETGITTRAYSVVQNPNVLGGILAMGGLLSLSLALSRAVTGVRRIAVAMVCVIQLGGLAVTFSRGAWIGFAIGLVAMIVLAYRRYVLAVAAAVIVGWFAAPQVFIQRLLFSFSSTYAAKSSTGQGRLWRWDAALQHIADKPLLGVGLGTFGGTTAYMFGYWSIWVDNFYLQMAAEGGLLLLASFLWLLLRGVKGLVRAHASNDPYLKALSAGVFGAFLAVAVANVFEADWETLSVGVGFWFLAGLATSAVLAEPTAVEVASRTPDAAATSGADTGGPPAVSGAATVEAGVEGSEPLQ